MLPDAERFRLIGGQYRSPRCKVGSTIVCCLRGRVKVVAISDGLIQWPMTRNPDGGNKMFILCGDLVKAVRQESTQAIQHWFGVGSNTVWTWRKALGVAQNNQGTLRLRSKWWTDGGTGEATRPGREATFHSPERASKIAESKRGVPRPPHVHEAMRRGKDASPLSDESRRRMSEASKARGAYPPAAGRPFTPDEDELLGTMLDKDVAAKTGRHPVTIAKRRKRLGIASFRHRMRTL